MQALGPMLGGMMAGGAGSSNVAAQAGAGGQPKPTFMPQPITGIGNPRVGSGGMGAGMAGGSPGGDPFARPPVPGQTSGNISPFLAALGGGAQQTGAMQPNAPNPGASNAAISLLLRSLFRG